MPTITTIDNIDLKPKAGKIYTNIEREWREEFIYFLLVDRFHDDKDRAPLLRPGRSKGIRTPEDFYGGKIKGITNNLNYIAGLGCTAIWLSPVFENKEGAYHGYHIHNYLAIDPNFGTQEDLIELVDAAHNYKKNGRPFPIRVVLDVVINQSIDVEPETINNLIKSHCYWIKETDIDGFRVDAVKHIDELTCSYFCSSIREYAYSLNKRDFFIFGEMALSSDDIYNRYIAPNTSRQDGDSAVFPGINSLLDFRLASGIDGDANNRPLREVIKSEASPKTLFNRLGAQEKRALNRGEIGRYLVTFIDNHDSFWQPQGRLGATASDNQVIAGIGFLLCSLGAACIYYGTEQGFDGSGGDNHMREAMFDTAISSNQNLLNTNCTIYKEISKIADVMRTTPPLRFGRMYFRQISGNGVDFRFPDGKEYTLAFSRIVYGQEVLVAYNVSGSHRSDFVIIDNCYHKDGDKLNFLYGATGSVTVHQIHGGSTYVQLDLAPNQFVILK